MNIQYLDKECKGSGKMDKYKVSITLGIVCLILTIGICVQLKTINNTNATVGQAFAEDELRDEVLKWKEKYDNISEQLDNAESQLTKIREEATKDDATASEKEEQITLNNKLLGLTNLEGQGIEITLRDDPTATRDNIGVLDDISYHIVHDADLRVIVNELKNAGAEAISINEQRLVNTTAITCIGNVIKVNDEKISSPFVIKAIGLPESLASIDRPGSYMEILRQNGIVATIRKSNKIEIPKYTGVISAKYMNLQK